MASDYDIVIRGGTLADGTGGALINGDIAISDGKIAALGKLSGKGTEEIDARGKLVTPGFVDVHTHYDGQLTWANRMTPSSSHGVTTIITGNCGVGFAPCKPEDRDSMIRLMEGVEDIPEVVLSAGLPWNWQSFPEFLNALDAGTYDVDVSVLLPHSPMRVFTMGQRAVDLEPATEDDRKKMRAITKEAIEAGAIGFATSRNVYHKTSDGKPVPCFKSEEAEITEIAMGMVDAGRGTLQAVLITENQCLEDFERFHRVAKATGRPLTYTLLSTNEAPDLWRDVMRSVERDRAEGHVITPQVFNRPVGVIFGLDSNFSPFAHNAYYVEKLAPLPFEQRVAAMRQSEVKAALLASGTQNDGSMLASALRDYGQLYAMENPIDYEPEPAKSVAGVAAARGITPDEVLYDIVMAEDGRGKVMLASMNYSQHNLDHALEMLDRSDTVLALGDGGAHCGIICDASYPTTALTHWARDRKRGPRIPLEKVVRKLTSETANLYGFHDRGRLAYGMKADINIIDFDNLTMGPPIVVKDLPGEGSRLVQPPRGFDLTMVSGQITQREGTPTSALPGKLVRSGSLAHH